MKIAALFKNGRNQAVRLPREYEFDGISEVEVTKDGDRLILKPRRESWLSFAKVDDIEEQDFLLERESVIDDGRIVL